MQNTKHTWKFFRKVYTENKQKGNKGELLKGETNERRPKNLKTKKLNHKKDALAEQTIAENSTWHKTLKQSGCETTVKN